MAMEGYDATTYGERIAEVYDDWHPDCNPAAIETLAELAGSGRVLELAIGTGRVAVPLAGRGLEVHGIDISPAMVERLRARPGGASIPVTMGDFREVAAPGRFSLIFVAFNTFFALLTQEHQLDCFRNVAARLEEDGLFALEVFVPDLSRWVRGQVTQAVQVEEGHVKLDISTHDPVSQVVTTQHVLIREEGTRLYPVKLRYAWPAELDLMARLAGLRLRDRWSDWDRSRFTAASTKHVSVYERDEGD
jgi:SAM-dependent methyltransferase